MATIKDIAKNLGISVASVSMALNDSPEISLETKKKVRSKANELNYVKNGSALDLQRQKTNTVLFIADSVTSPYFADAIKVLDAGLSKISMGLLVVVHNDELSLNTIRFLEEQRADAVVCWSSMIKTSVLNDCASNKMPIFTLGRKNLEISNSYIFNVPIDQNRAGQEITQYLITQGFKKIAFIHVEGSIGSEIRKQGFLNSIQQSNKKVQGTIISTLSGTYVDGYAITKQIVQEIKKKKMDALFFTNDDLAVGGNQALREENIKVPEDISMVGYGNYPISQIISPTLTTVDLHEQEIMEETVQNLVSLLLSQKSNIEIQEKISKFQLQSEIIYRNSVLENH